MNPPATSTRLPAKRIIDLLFELNREQGTTLIMATHDEELASQCERRLHLQGGKLVNQ